MNDGVKALLAALPVGLRKGSDTRGFLISVVQDYDAASGRVLAAVGEESAWLYALTGTYTAGDLVAVARNPWTGKAELVLGVLPPGSLTVTPPAETGSTEVEVRYEGAVRITTTILPGHHANPTPDQPGGS